MSITPETHHAYSGLPGLEPDRVVYVAHAGVTIEIDGRVIALKPYRIEWPEDGPATARRRRLEECPVD